MSVRYLRFVLDNTSYIRAIEETSINHKKFYNLDIPTGKENNYKKVYKKIITSNLKLLKNEEIIDKDTYKSIKPVGSRVGILYRLGKVHEETKNEVTLLRPILSAIGTPTYKLTKFLLWLLTSLTEN